MECGDTDNEKGEKSALVLCGIPFILLIIIKRKVKLVVDFLMLLLDNNYCSASVKGTFTR